MKNIGDINVQIATPEEITFSRSVVFDALFTLLTNSINNATMQIFVNQYHGLVENGLNHKAHLLLHDFITACNMSTEPHENTWGLCFACICNEQGEDTNKYSEDFLKSKLKRFIDAGLLMKDVKREVENFMSVSNPLLLASYLRRKVLN